jgi:hypothetical protein
MTDVFFTDFLAIHSMAIADTHINMFCSYIDPLTGTTKLDHIDVSFDALYPFLDDRYAENADHALDILAQLAAKEDMGWIDVDKGKAIILHGLIFRLDFTYPCRSDNRIIHEGFLITHIVEMGRYAVTYLDWVKPSKDKPASHRRRSTPAFRALSAQLSSLALRFMFYQRSLANGMKQGQARELADLKDKHDLRAARAAAHHLDIFQGKLT